jgi:hypothetical protein
MSKQTLRRYTLTESVLKQRYLKRGWNLPLVCYKCGRVINIGERIVRKRRKVYHESCYDSMFLDIPEISDDEDLEFIKSGNISVSSSISITSTIPPNSLQMHILRA